MDVLRDRMGNSNNIFLIGLALFLFFGTGLAFWIKLLLLALSWLFLGNGYHWCYLFANTWRRDTRYV